MDIKITNLWRFMPDPSRDGINTKFSSPEYDDHLWREVQIPSDFEMCLPGLDAYEGAGWYRTWLDIPEQWNGKRIALHFEGVNTEATVYVNSAQKKLQPDPYLPFEMDISNVVIPGEKALVAVCVDNTRKPEAVPGIERGWRTYGGILREVSLRVTAPCHLTLVDVKAEPVPDGGKLKVDYVITNEASETASVDLQVRLLDADGKTLWKDRGRCKDLEAHADVIFSFEETVSGVVSWSPDNPQLYTLSAKVTVDKGVYSRHQVHTGFRSIEARDGKLLLNGEPIYLTGFNRHEDSLKRHQCTDLETARSDFKEMKRAGANFVRLCHYPHHPGELGICDELGLLVMAEIPLYWWKGLADGDDVYEEKLITAERQLSELMIRDGNHPSVVFWSVSNETEERQPGVVEGNAQLIEYVQGFDETRLAVHVSNHWHDEPHFDVDDVICVNSYPSVFQRKAISEETYDFALATAYWQDSLAKLHEAFPDKPILVAEFGYEGVQYVTDGPWSEDNQVKALEAEFAGMQADYICGATVWCWADHPWNPSTFEFAHYLGISPYGIVGRDRRPKKALYAMRELFKQKHGITEAKPEPPMRNEAGIFVTMVRKNMDNLPEYTMPEGYKIRTLRDDEGGLWTDIWRDAEPFGNIGTDLYHQEFGSDYVATTWRTFIVEDERGLAVAMITSWYNRTFKGEDFGQIHWVATRQSQWGRGIGRGMLSHALREMAMWHDCAFLGTQTNRIPAIKLYLDFGFEPDMDQPFAEQAWREVKSGLSHPLLDKLDI